MPLDKQLFAAMGIDLSEQPAAGLDPEVMDFSQQFADAMRQRRILVRDTHLGGLTSTLTGVRDRATDKAAKEVTSPRERQELIEDVTEASEAMGWVRQREYEQSGFLGKFGKRAQQVGEGFVSGGSAMLGALKFYRDWSQNRGPTVADVRFKRDLQRARNAGDPTIRQDDPLTLKGVHGGLAMAPDLSAGLLAAAGGDRWGMFAYWTARLFPERMQDYLEAGHSQGDAVVAGAVTAAAESAIELLNIAPPGVRQIGRSKLGQGVVRRGISDVIERFGGKQFIATVQKYPVIGKAIGGAVDALERIGIEITEEGMQAGTRRFGQYLAAKHDPKITGPTFSKIAPEMWQEMKDTAPAIFTLGGVTGGAMAVGERAVAKQEAKMKKVRDEIVEYAESGRVPSRRKRVEWGLPEEGWESRQQRREGVEVLAEEIRAEERIQREYETIQQIKEGAPEEAQVAAGMATKAAPGVMGPSEAAAEFRADPKGALKEHPEAQAAVEEAVGVPTIAAKVIGVAVVPSEIPGVNIQEVEQKGMLGDFIEDSAGRIGISVNVIGEKVHHLTKRFLTSKGELPQAAFDAKVRRDGAVSRIQAEIGFTLKDYDRAVKDTYGVSDIPIEEQQRIDSVLKGEVSIDDLPAALRGPVFKMRGGIDALSRRLIEIGAVQGKMALVVGENLGVYMTRSYRAFDDPNWAKMVPKDVRNKAAALLRQEYPEKSEEEIQGLIEAILYEGKAAETPIALLSRSKLGSKDLSILTRRKEIPAEIRALLGEYKDPRVNYARSMTMVGNLVANHQFLTEVRDAGMGTFFSKEPIVSDLGELKTRIAVDESSTMSPLNGLYTTPEIKDAFERVTSREQLPDWLRVYLGASGIVKVAKTVGSPMTHVRNTIGNIGFAVANGHWMVGKFGPAWKGTMTGLLKKNSEEWRAYYLRAMELGLVRQDTRSGELRDHIQDASKADMDEFAYSTEARRAHRVKFGLKVSAQAVARTYQAEDDVWKLYAWENEKARYRKAMPELSETEIEELTAQIVRDTYPTYSLVPEGVKQLRRFPLVGTFVSFPAEVIRTTYHTLAQAKREMSDSRTRSIGAQRVAGLSVMATGTAAITAMLRLLIGVSREDDEGMRSFVAPWQVNNQFAHLGRTPDGNFRFIDLSYSDPHNTIRTPLIAFMRGDNLKDKIWDSLRDAADPFMGEEILYGKFSEAWNNNANGRQVYNPEDDIGPQSKDIISHLWTAFEPGLITSARRIGLGISDKVSETGRSYDPRIETVAVLTGQRIQDLDVAQSLQYRIYEFARRKRGADDILSSVLRRHGEVSRSEIIDAYQRSDTRRRELYGEMSKVIRDARNLGVSDEQIANALDSARLSTRDRRAVFAGVYVPRKIAIKGLSEDRRSAILEAYDEFN